MSDSSKPYLKKYPIRFLTNVEAYPSINPTGTPFVFKKGATFKYIDELNVKNAWFHVVTPDGRNIFNVPLSYTIDFDFVYKQLTKTEKKEYDGQLNREFDRHADEALRIEEERKRNEAANDDSKKEDYTFLYWIGAGVAGVAALQQEDQTTQVVLGGTSALLAVLALGKSIPKLPKVPKVGAIGWMGTVQWRKPYAIFPSKANHYKSQSNIAFAQGKVGIYQIKKNGTIIYIGKGANVYKTCLRHFEAHEPYNANKQEYHKDYLRNDYQVRITLCGTMERAQRIETLLIRKHRPKDNKQIPDELPLASKDMVIYQTTPKYWEVESPF
jgi:hypothetical protein